jgi:hypothetical protein
MTFIHGYLLAGLVLVGAPVLLHLVMRQKPRPLPFPAFRFLRQRHLINRRRLRLQYLLLLLLRMLLIAALCLALARPRAFSNRAATSSERPVAAVLVFDTSPSMEYTAGGQTRLDEAKHRARELLDEMADGSQVAVLDSGDETSADWLPRSDLVYSRVENLRIRPGGGPVTRPLGNACRLLEQAATGEDAPPRFLYVFSDRMSGCWDGGEARRLKVPEGVNAVFVDVGADRPQDLGIEAVKVEPPVASAGRRVRILATVRSTGRDHENDLLCQLDNEPDPERGLQKRALRLARDRSEVVPFEWTAPTRSPGGPADIPFQVTVRLGSNDSLPFNNTHFATFAVRESRKILTIVQDRPHDARFWKAALDAVGEFRCEVKTLAEAETLTAQDLQAYKVVCLFQVAGVPDRFWGQLETYIRGGGGLALVPGSEEGGLKTFDEEAGRHGLLPAKLTGIHQAPGPVYWSGFSARHPLTAPFLRWKQNADPDFEHSEIRPFVTRYWEAEAPGPEAVIVTYDDKKKSPALAEKLLDRGRVVLFTVPLGGDAVEGERRWHNYWEDSSFGLVLVDRVCRYLAGELAVHELNYLCGQMVQVMVPTPPEPPYTLEGPNLAAAETNLRTPEADGRLPIPQAAAPGNYAILDGRGRRVAGFSLNVRPEESVLERVPAEEIEAVLGKGSLLQVGRAVNLREALQGLRAPPLELLPYLMIGLLLLLPLESLLANRFYRRPVADPGGAAGPEPERTSS